MSSYRNILVAVDGSEESVTILRRALQLVDDEVTLNVVLVMETLPGNYVFELNMADFERLQIEHQERIAEKMRELMARTFPTIPASAVHFLRGKAATEIKRMAEDTGVDLVVIGSHGHNPVRAMLGSTANAVLHGIHCDVLTVRV